MKRLRMIATDGVFSMDGEIAKLPEIVALAEKYQAMVMVDDSHATGVLGKGGRGTPNATGTAGKIDIITSTFGKACGGGSGGFTAGRKPIIDLLRQRSRPYLFSNSIPPVIAAVALKTISLVENMEEDRARLLNHTQYFREQMAKKGFTIKPGQHPIVPVMLGEAPVAEKMAQALLEQGIYVVGFWYPVVPQGQARIRVQISAAHTREQVEQAVAAFVKVRKELGL
jgi:glycine C-acetyltransferase